MATHRSSDKGDASVYDALLAEAERNGATVSRSAFSIEPIPDMGYGVIAQTALQVGQTL